MLPFGVHTLRVALHILAACVWVGGQLVLPALLPTLRRAGADVPATVARRFALVAWPAYAVLLVTGVWNLVAVEVGTDYLVTLAVKLGAVVVSGVGAAVHQFATTARIRGVAAGIGLLGALAAVVLGVTLRG